MLELVVVVVEICRAHYAAPLMPQNNARTPKFPKDEPTDLQVASRPCRPTLTDLHGRRRNRRNRQQAVHTFDCIRRR